LFHPRAKSFLLTEALRGEGGVLVDGAGRRFMPAYDERAELAPRDIVARAIDSEMKRTAADCVFLDITALDRGFIERRFPSILERCLGFGIDPRTQPIPVVPATHYFCGGVDVDDRGRSSAANLFAIGEVSHTGLHGANRLASNSLLEALVFAERAYDAVLRGADAVGVPNVRPWVAPGSGAAPDPVVLEHDWDEARRVMWDYVGIVRSDERLAIADERMSLLAQTVEREYRRACVTQDVLELRNIVQVGRLVVRAAQARKESRGLHYTESYPTRDDDRFVRDTVLTLEAEA
jgi:L-aspartate oxidase